MAKLLKLVKEKILTDKFFYIGIAFLLFFIPVYPKFPLFSVKGTYVSIRIEDFIVAFVVVGFLLRLLLNKDFSILKNKVTQLVLLYFAIGFVSVISAFFITKNITLHIALLHFVRRIEYLSLLFVAYYSFKDIKQLKTFWKVIMIASMLVIIYGLGQKFFGWPVVSTMNKEFSKGLILKLTWWARVNSTFAGHYDLAAYMVMILALCFSSFMVLKKPIAKIATLFLGIASYYILILTASRISFVAYLAAILFVLIFSKKMIWIAPFLIISILGMVFSADLGQRYAATFKINLSFLSGTFKVKEIAYVIPTEMPIPTKAPPLKPVTPAPYVTLVPTSTPTSTPTPTPEPVSTGSAEYFEPTQLAVDRSTDIRFKVEWPRAIRAFLKNPLLGTGYSSITLATDNDYLRALGETGLLGSLAFMAIILEIARKVFLFIKNKKSGRVEKLLVIGFSGAAIGYFINAGFIDVLEASKIAFFFWIMMGVSLRIIDLNEKHDD